MFKVVVIALVFFNAFAAGHMHAQAHAPASSDMPHHVHSSHLSDAEDADETQHSDQNISYNCCVGTATHCGTGILSTLQFAPHGLFQLALEHAPITDADMRNRVLTSDPPPPKS